VPHGRPVLERIWERVDKSGDCWLWLGGKDGDGYGLITVRDESHRVTRLLWETERGTIQAGFCVCHSCDNPSCVRLEHLFLGTAKDNSQDMIGKGRSLSGIRNPAATLTENDVIDIRTLRAFGAKRVILMKAFEISKTQLTRVLNRSSWATV